jgi:hypothetical protein
LPPGFTHKFEKKNTKVLEKNKLPYDQSRKIFSIHQLHGLRELVHLAVPASDTTRREEWMTFLYHYVNVNERLHSPLEYTAEDIEALEKDTDAAYCLFVKSIGGKERGVTNYFHFLESGHLMWMVRRYGNLWRFCNEGVESLNGLASKRYNGFNNKGGYKSTCKDKSKLKCLPFEVLGDWLARLSMWHIGMADTMFAVESAKGLVWDETTTSYVASPDYLSEDVDDSDWNSDSIYEEFDGICNSDEDEDNSTCSEDGYESDDISWCSMSPSMQTWAKTTEKHVKVSMRKKYQLMPLTCQPCLIKLD